VFNAQVVRYWKTLCEERHQGHPRSPCRGRQNSALIADDVTNQVAGLRVIDVQNKCVVEYDWHGMEPYCALSYVWGTRPFLTLNKMNEAALRKRNSLSSIPLPDTIADAIDVVEQMGDKYLWVDSLCIVQDDESDQKRFIRMGTIYGQADLTIIALCGEDAYAGLPGVRKEKPRMRQQEIEIEGVSMLPVMMPTGWAETYKLAETKFTTRAWTNQETLLSRRRLVFGREQAYFICQSIWFEDVVGMDFTPFIDTFARLQLYGSLRPLTGTLQKHFCDIVNRYTGRNLTHRHDRLNGISGILEELSKMIGPFFQGIPLSCFSNAILWDRDFNRTGFPRQIDETYSHQERLLRIPGLPSWSWVGWMCQIRFEKGFDDVPVSGRLRFYGCTSDAGLVELETPEHKAAQTYAWGSSPGSMTLTDARALPIHFWQGKQTVVKLEDVAGLVSETPLLCFWTWTATVKVEAKSNSTQCFKTSTGQLVSVGFRVYVPPGKTKELDLIVIGDLSYSQMNRTPAVAVIAIRWESGIAYREPYGRVTIDYRDWKDIEGICWRRIIIG
jgi:hypothetical protein